MLSDSRTKGQSYELRLCFKKIDQKKEKREEEEKEEEEED